MVRDKNLELNVRKLLSKVKQSKISTLDLKAGDFILTCDSKEEMQKYIRWGKVIELIDNGVILDKGYNVNLVSEKEADVLRSMQTYPAENDHFAYKLDLADVFEQQSLIKYFKGIELMYLHECIY